ncbi:hypothetical protein, partial [Novosphingobium sp.]|uniref:hypothetical protein n=1 Tax=Novosphingobium sp. TaxID=1874826 RepID=UPI002FE4098D
MDTTLMSEGRKISCSPSRLEIKPSQIEDTNCLGRMNDGPKPNGSGALLKESAPEVKRFGSVWKMPKGGIFLRHRPTPPPD